MPNGPAYRVISYDYDWMLSDGMLLGGEASSTT